MEKIICTIVLSMIISVAKSQRNYTLATSANFNFATKGLGTNDAGIGLTVHTNFFWKKKLQLRAEASMDHFIGSKELHIDSVGNSYGGTLTMLSIKAGPEFFIADNISVSALYGLVRYKYFSDNVRSGNLKLLWNAYLGKTKRTVLGLYYSGLSNDDRKVNFLGISVGYRFL